MAWRKGQKVVCVDAGAHVRYSPTHIFHLFSRDMHGLREGAIYTVADIIEWYGILELVLMEIVRDPKNLGFATQRFRPLVSDDARFDISALMPKKEPVNV